MKNLSFCDRNRRQIHLISDKVWMNNVIFIWTGFNYIFFKKLFSHLFSIYSFYSGIQMRVCLRVLWDFWLLMAHSFPRQESLPSGIWSPRSPRWRAPFSHCNKTGSCYFFCQENIKVSLSECTSLFRKRGLVFCQKSERSLSFPTLFVFWSTCWQISQHQARHEIKFIWIQENFCASLWYIWNAHQTRRERFNVVICSVNFANSCFFGK